MVETKTVMMPRTLTAENGAKAALMGEFSVRFPIICPECENDNWEYCKNCDGEGQVFQEINVPWTVIKEIYAKAVDCVGV